MADDNDTVEPVGAVRRRQLICNHCDARYKEAGMWCWMCIITVCCSRHSRCAHDDNPRRPKYLRRRG